MLIIEEKDFALRPGKGRLLKLGHTNEEALNFLKTFEVPNQEGWIETDHKLIQSHIRGHNDGKGAVLTSGRLTPEDFNWFEHLLGTESAKLLTRHHNIY